MSTILFATWDGGGNVPPMLGIAAELDSRGHRVRVLGHPGQSERFARAGLPFGSYPHGRPFTSTTPSSTMTMLGVFGDRAMGGDVVAELASDPADVVVVDCLLFGVMDALRQAGRPYVVLEHSLDGYFRRTARGPLGWLMRLRGFRPLDLIDHGSPVLTVSLEELDEGHGDVVHTGPVLGDVAPSEPTSSGEPTVLLSLSTFAFPALTRTWQRALDAVDGLPARVVATIGPAVDADALRVPANVELHRWLPHDEVMPRVSLLVGHGGHATTMAALAHDLPVLVLPVDAKTDQAHLGAALERAGVGRRLSRRSSPARIRAAIEELLAEGHHREAAARIGHRIRELDGRRRAADIVEQLVADGVPRSG